MRIDRQAFYEAMNELSRVASAKAILPIQRSVLIEAKDGLATLRATDLDQHLTCQLAAEGEIIACLPAKTLAKLVKPERKSDKGDVIIEQKAEHSFSVCIDGLATNLHGIDPSEFPACFESEDWQLTAMWPAKPVKEALAYVLPAVSGDPTRQNLCSVHFAGDHVESTDGHRLHRMPLPTPLAEPLLVPALSAVTLKRILAGAEQVILARADDFLRLKAGIFQLDTRLLDACFPETERVVPDKGAASTTVEVETKVFSQALSRIGRLSSAESVRLVVNGELAISAWDAELGDTSTTVPTVSNDHTGEDLVVGFNRRYLQDALATKDKSVELAFSDAMGPLRLDAGARLAVVMPMRM